MSEHEVTVRWQRANADFTYESYHREHDATFGGGFTLVGSAAKEYRGKPEHPNPEEALVYALSSCHMLTFLAVAAKRGLVVDRYEDNAVGVLAKNAKGKLAVTKVTLRPRVTWGGEAPAADTVARIHEVSHRECFIANSVTTEVVVEG